MTWDEWRLFLAEVEAMSLKSSLFSDLENVVISWSCDASRVISAFASATAAVAEAFGDVVAPFFEEVAGGEP